MNTQIQQQQVGGLERATQKGTDGLDHIGQNFNEGYFEDVLGGLAKRTVTDLRERVTRLNDRRETFNPKLTAAQNCENLKTDVKNFDEHSVREMNRVANEFKREITALETTLNDDANLYQKSERILSIAGSFYGLSKAEQQKAITEALEEDDGPMLAVLINSSKVETGLSKAEREFIRRRAWEKANPNGVRSLDELREKSERWEAGCYGMVNVKQKLASELNRYDADIARAEAVHGNRKPSAGFVS